MSQRCDLGLQDQALGDLAALTAFLLLAMPLAAPML